MQQEVLTASSSVPCWAEDLSHLYPVLRAFIPLLPSPDCDTLSEEELCLVHFMLLARGKGSTTRREFNTCGMGNWVEGLGVHSE